MQPPASFAPALKISWTLYSDAARDVDDVECVINLVIAPNLLCSMNPKPPYNSNKNNSNSNKTKYSKFEQQLKYFQQQQQLILQQQRTLNEIKMQICTVN